MLLISGEIKKTSYLFNFFFSTKRYQEQNAKEYYQREINKYNTEKQKYPDNQVQSFIKIRKRIKWAFFAVVSIALYSLMSVYLASGLGLSLSKEQLILIQSVAIMVVFWALLSQLGWEIRTIKGLTLNEYINDLWFRLLNAISIYLLLFSNIYQLIKK